MHFHSTRFSKENLSLFKDWKLGEKKKSKQSSSAIHFREVIFNDHVEFLDCDFSLVEFLYNDVTEVKLTNVKFPKRKFRMYFAHESYIDSKRDKDSRLRSQDKLGHYERIQEVYRQFKIALIKNDNWTEAMDAYMSEKIIERKMLWLRFLKRPWSFFYLTGYITNRLHHIINSFNQSMVRPIFWLALTLYLFTFILMRLTDLDLPTAMTDSVYAMVPLTGDLELGEIEDINWQIRLTLVMERLMAFVFFAAFVLASRNRGFLRDSFK